MDSHANHDIANNQLTGKYYYVSGSTYYPPWQARLGNNRYDTFGQERAFWWGPGGGAGQWWQVDFLTPHTIAGLTMDGGSNSYFTKTFKLQYSKTSPAVLEYLLDESGNEKV